MHISILATRIAGTDGVSLEAERWREILEGMHHKVDFVAGQLDRSGTVIPELHFQSPEVVKLHDKIIYGDGNFRKIEAEVFALAGLIEGKLRAHFNKKELPDLLIVPNVFSLPMHFPLAVAVARLIEEFKTPTIARHHDFWWERGRFLKSTMFDFFKRWFPPNLPQIRHVVINSIAQENLIKRTNLSSEVIWDCFDFKSSRNKKDAYSKHWRKDFGIKKDDIVFLQATRIVPRKRIELAIEFVKKLNDPQVVLVIAGYSGDEGKSYEKKLRKLAKNSGIRFRFIGDFVNSERKIRKVENGKTPKRRRVYTLWDCFVNADFVTYPTRVEGFGNQFIETMYFKKPIIITPYKVYKKDIKPLGFETIEIPHRVTEKALNEVRELIDDPEKRDAMVEENFKLGKKNFSYQWVEKKLKGMFKEMNLQ
jgi:glycosyltransferase involved in cell wall biosynthesis